MSFNSIRAQSGCLSSFGLHWCQTATVWLASSSLSSCCPGSLAHRRPRSHHGLLCPRAPGGVPLSIYINYSIVLTVSGCWCVQSKRSHQEHLLELSWCSHTLLCCPLYANSSALMSPALSYFDYWAIIYQPGQAPALAKSALLLFERHLSAPNHQGGWNLACFLFTAKTIGSVSESYYINWISTWISTNNYQWAFASSFLLALILKNLYCS